MQGDELAAVLAGERAWTVLCADQSDILATLGDGAVDVCLTDPPYDKRTCAGVRSGTTPKQAVDLGFVHLDPGSFVPELLRVTRRWVVSFCALEQLGAYQTAAGDEWVRAGFWRKADGAPQFTGDRPGQPGEGLAIMHRRGRKAWNRGGHHAYWEHGRVRKGRIHPCQKPLSLMLDLVMAFTQPGEVVLDPFAGVSTTGLACLHLGRRYIGIERHPQWLTPARRALEAVEAISTDEARAS